MLDDQNIELEKELDRFMLSDQEIRNKLGDRNRSPLRLDDLHLDHDLKERGIVGTQVPHPPPLLVEEDFISDPYSRVKFIGSSPFPPR